jgi:hypothetical protein
MLAAIAEEFAIVAHYTTSRILNIIYIGCLVIAGEF